MLYVFFFHRIPYTVSYERLAKFRTLNTEHYSFRMACTPCKKIYNLKVFGGSKSGERKNKKKKTAENNCLRLTTMNGNANRKKKMISLLNVEMQCGRLNEK